MNKGRGIALTLLHAVILFCVIYLPLHMVYFYWGGYETDVVMLVSSAVWGVIVSIIYGLILKRRLDVRPRQFFVLYALVHTIVLATNYALFSYGPYEGKMQVLFYYYPQTIIVLFGLISAAVFWCILFLTKAFKNRIK